MLTKHFPDGSQGNLLAPRAPAATRHLVRDIVRHARWREVTRQDMQGLASSGLCDTWRCVLHKRCAKFPTLPSSTLDTVLSGSFASPHTLGHAHCPDCLAARPDRAHVFWSCPVHDDIRSGIWRAASADLTALTANGSLALRLCGLLTNQDVAMFGRARALRLARSALLTLCRIAARVLDARSSRGAVPAPWPPGAAAVGLPPSLPPRPPPRCTHPAAAATIAPGFPGPSLGAGPGEPSLSL